MNYQTNIVSMNIPTQVGVLNWGRAFRRMFKRPGGNIGMAQEVFTPKAKKLARRMAKRRGWGSYGVANSPNPIFYDKKVWEKVDGFITRIHGRLSKADDFPGFNGARFVTVLVLRNKVTGRIETFMNTHLVPEGRKVAALDRIRARRKSKKVIAEIAREQVKLGRTVWIGGDTNWAKNFRLNIPGFRWIRKKGIDKGGVAPGKGLRVIRQSWDAFHAPEVDHKHGIQFTAVIAEAA